MHLHVHSYYSFLAGTLSVDRLIQAARAHGLSSLALTDTNNVTGVTEFYSACRKNGIKPIIGADLRARNHLVTTLAKNWDGYASICRTVTNLSAYHPPARILLEESASGKTAQVEDRDACDLVTLIGANQSSDVVFLCADPELIPRLVEICTPDQIYVELIKGQEGRWNVLARLARQLSLRTVATNDVYFGDPRGWNLHRILRSIATNATVATIADPEVSHPSQYFCAESEFQEWFHQYPEALLNRRVIIDQCNVELDFSSSKFTKFNDDDILTRFELLRKETDLGFCRRYAKPEAVHYERLEKEFRIIRQLGFVDYFLVAWDVVRYAARKNYPYVGRGSGANSIVAYCLGITNVDPIELDLFFERFLNPERRSPPDFDIDFSWRNRDDVIDYVLRKYDDERTAMICTISTFNPRGALREVGKVLGFSEAEIKHLTALMPSYGSIADFEDDSSNLYRHSGVVTSSPYGKQWLRIATRLLDFPNHYGIHSGGVILAPDVMTRYSATQISPKGVRITQQDMFGMEDWHLEKLDILSTRGLGTYEDTMREVERRTGSAPPVIDYRIPCGDARTKEIMRTGKTIGCFYVESPAMIQLLKKLRTDTFEMLTAASSIIRPGVAQSGMMQAFIERFHDPAKIKPPHPMMAELLRTTFGVMVYQEDVIKVAHFIGKLTLGEADLLRRAMSGKMRSHEAMRALRDSFFAGCRSQGISDDVTSEIWRQMESFAGYSFCKAHSASYAVLSFQEAYLKAHHPAIFLCSVLNNQGGYYRPHVYIQEARRLGITILLPNVNVSEALHTCPDDRSIQLGYLHVKGCTEKSVRNIIAARMGGGPYRDFPDFMQRSGATPEDIGILITCGACDSFGAKRSTLMAEARLLSRGLRDRQSSMGLQLSFENFGEELKELRDYSERQKTEIELETFSYTVSSHVLDHFAEQLAGTIRADDLAKYVGKRITVAGWMIAAKVTRTRKGERMMFLNLDDSTGNIDVVLFPKCYHHYSHLLRTAGPFKVTGRVAEEYNVINLVGEKVEVMKE